MSADEVRKKVTIVNALGLHARAATVFVKLASEYSSDVLICKAGQEVNGKSIMAILMLAATKGSEIELVARGDDADAAIGALAQLVADRFGEDK